MNVSGLKSVGDTLTATFTIANTSTDITAYLSNTVTNTNTEYFEVTSTLGSTQLAPQTGTTNLNVAVKLIKTPVTGNQTDTLTVEVIASPTKKEVKLISFQIVNAYEGTYYAEEGMTWFEWVDSEYNTIGMANDGGWVYHPNDGYMLDLGFAIESDGVWSYDWDRNLSHGDSIVNGEIYYLGSV